MYLRKTNLFPDRFECLTCSDVLSVESYPTGTGVSESFQAVRGRPPLKPIYMLIYLQMGGWGTKAFHFFARGTVLKKVENPCPRIMRSPYKTPCKCIDNDKNTYLRQALTVSEDGEHEGVLCTVSEPVDQHLGLALRLVVLEHWQTRLVHRPHFCPRRILPKQFTCYSINNSISNQTVTCKDERIFTIAIFFL